MPSHSSPSVTVASMPLIRGEPSRRRVARTLCLWASKAALARPASSGAAASISLQLAMARVYARFLALTASRETGVWTTRSRWETVWQFRRWGNA